MKQFQEIFGKPPEIEASAPGRVNLIGEHTDYNDGFVLPTAIPQNTTVKLSFSNDIQHHFYSQELDEKVSISENEATAQGFASYILGCIRVLEKAGYKIPPLNLYVTSSVPMGSGLSSSAALEVATLRGVRSLLNLDIDDVQIAQLGQQAEIQYAGVQCGIMDQMASSLADTHSMLFLDTRTLECRVLPFPADAEILVIDSGVPRTLANSGYNQRRAECEEAARLLKVKALRDITDPQAVEILPEPLRRRARHVVTENNRVLEVQQGLSAQRFGELMNASHASLRDDYEVSVPPLDTLVAMLQETPGVFGARLTGAGFGGACVALVEAGKANAIAQDILSRYNRTGYTGRILVPEAIHPSSPEVVFGNASVEGANRGGWFMGYFIDLPNDPRSTSTLEVKWGSHTAGDSRTQWAVNSEATTLSILINGRFRLHFPDKEVLLSKTGDYVLWSPGVAHWWVAESDSTILTVRWPSKSGDSVGLLTQFPESK